MKVKPVHLELVEGAKPYHVRPFPVPKSVEATTKKEILRLEDIGVLIKNYNIE